MIDNRPGLSLGVGAKAQAFAALLLATVMLIGCAAPRGKGTAKELPAQVYWPEPPDPPRLKFEATLRSAAGLEEESEEQLFKRMMIGQAQTVSPAFAKPGGIAAHKGRIYVVDTVMRSVAVFDVPRRRVFRFGVREPNRLQKPTDIAVDDLGRTYVTDVKAKTVMVFDSLGLYLRSVGKPGDFERPVGVAVNRAGDRIYVVDRGTVEDEKHQVLVFDDEGKHLRTLGPRGKEPGQFNMPVAASVASDGTLFVLDAGNFRVQSFDPEGNFLKAFGQAGNALGDLARPRGIAVDRENNIYVTDAMFGNFQIFSREGQLLLAVGQLKRSDGRAHYGLPASIAVDDDNRVYVADQLFNKVEVFRRLSEIESESLVAGGAAVSK